MQDVTKPEGEALKENDIVELEGLEESLDRSSKFWFLFSKKKNVSYM